MVVVQSETQSRPSRLLWVGVAGLGGRSRGELTSTDTQVRGLLSSTDIAPTILAHERVAIPASVQGSPARVEGGLDGHALRGTIARLAAIGGRRLPALGWLLAAWALLLVACSRTAAGRRWALRTGALGVLWAPVVAMLTAALAPSAAVEYALLAVLCPLLGALSDGLLGWPRALLAPAIACVGGDRGRRAGGQPAAAALAGRSRPRPGGALPRGRQRPQVGSGGARAGGRGSRAVPVRAGTAGVVGDGALAGWRWPAWRGRPDSVPASAGW